MSDTAGIRGDDENGAHFKLVGRQSGAERVSGVTEVEDVSYASPASNMRTNTADSLNT